MSTPPISEPESLVIFGRRLPVTAEHVRYLLVGAYNTAFGYGIFAALHLALPDLHYEIVLLISQVIATLNAFVGYRYIVFKVRGHFFLDLARFFLVYAGAFAFNLIALPVGVEGFGLSPLVVQAGIVVVAVVSSYIGHKRFSFRRPSAG